MSATDCSIPRRTRVRCIAARRSQRGVTSIEYALIAGLIAMAIVVAVTAVGTTLGTFFDGVASQVSGANGK